MDIYTCVCCRGKKLLLKSQSFLIVKSVTQNMIIGNLEITTENKIKRNWKDKLQNKKS